MPPVPPYNILLVNIIKNVSIYASSRQTATLYPSDECKFNIQFPFASVSLVAEFVCLLFGAGQVTHCTLCLSELLHKKNNSCLLLFNARLTQVARVNQNIKVEQQNQKNYMTDTKKLCEAVESQVQIMYMQSPFTLYIVI